VGAFAGTIAGLLGALLGSVLAEWMPAHVLRRVFAIFEWLVAAQLIVGLRPKPGRKVSQFPGMAAVGG